MAETWQKRERERMKRQRKQEKKEKREDRQQHKGPTDLNDMLAYVDENGNLTSVPPDRNR